MADRDEDSFYPSEQEMEKLKAGLLNRMVQNGEYQRIHATLKSKLNEAGWIDQVRSQAKETARAQKDLDFQSLQDDVATYALDALPSSVKTEILSQIRAYVDTQIEPSGEFVPAR